MNHVKPIVENLPEDTTLITERLGEGFYEFVYPKEGDSPHPSNIVNIGSESRRIAGNHVAVYPERLVNYFIQGSTDEDDLVLDPFMGTGTTAVIAKALGRNYIGFDTNKEYVRFAIDRVRQGPYLLELVRDPKQSSIEDFN